MLAGIKKPGFCWLLALLLIALGAALILLPPETWHGLALLNIGVSPELADAAMRGLDSP